MAKRDFALGGGVLNWIEIDESAIRNNLGQFRNAVARGVRIGAVVKSNAYGHGMLEIARIVTDEGADWLCVNNLEEASSLRSAGFSHPILIMGRVPVEAAGDVVRMELRPVLYDTEMVEALQRFATSAGERVSVHLKLETGTHRQGLEGTELDRLLQCLRMADRIDVEGAYTHYANIEDTTDHGFARSQIESYQRLLDRVESILGRRVPIRHTACSAASLLFPETHHELIRLGISLYGVWPSRETLVSCRERGQVLPDLRPALTWKTRVAQVKTVPEGAFVSYGCTYRTTRESRIAVLPLGYYEGYDRGLSGVAHVLVKGRRARVLGRVCMNMTMVDITDIGAVVPGDEVVLLGHQKGETIPAEQVAAWCGTIPYEVLARIHPGLPRVVFGGSD